MDKRTGMIDVGKKEKTERTAKASVFVKLNTELAEKIKNKDMPKGDVLEIARVAGILAAKKTPALIPLCHNIELEHIAIDFVLRENGIVIESSAKSTAKTGVEMEAMVACSVAALTIYDMCKMFTKAIEITGLHLIEKRGGKGGVYRKDTLA